MEPTPAATSAPGRIPGSGLRADFPALCQRINEHPIVYLDNAATTQKPRQLIDALVDFYENDNANIHRSVHTLAARASERYENARARTAAFIGAADPSSVIFTRNTTESINLLAHAWGDANLSEGDEIVVSAMEHHSNIVPWQLLAHRRGARLRFVGLTEEYALDMDELRAALTPRARAVCITLASNVLGTITPIEEVCEAARSVGARVFVDGAQSVPHIATDVGSMGCDALSFSAHKMLGPTGVGVLWARPELLDEMPPFMGGGLMIATVMEQESTWAEVPQKFEAGTPNIADVAAFPAALDYLTSAGMRAMHDHEIAISSYALDRLATLPGLRMFGPADPEKRTATFSFAVDWAHPHDIATVLDQQGIAIRAGHHCAQPLMRRLGVTATSRASFYLYNGHDDVDALVAGLQECHRVLAGER